MRVCFGPKADPGCLQDRREAGWAFILRFLIVVRKERRLPVQAAAQEGSAQPKDCKGSRQGMPGQGTGRREDHRALLPTSITQSIACTNHRGSGPGDHIGPCEDDEDCQLPLWICHIPSALQ